MPRTTSHSVWPSATVPVVEGAGAVLPVEALASTGPPAADNPGQPPSALTKSPGATGLSGVSGGASIDTFFLKIRPERENHSASLDKRSDEKKSAVLEQPAMTGANTSKLNSRLR
jgi:hypothetical protein